MKLLGIANARILAWVELTELNPRGKVFYPELTQELVQRYNFQKFPQKIEEFDESKGIEFLMGKSGDIVIQKFSLWPNLLVVETRSSTTDSRAVVEEMLIWGKEKFGLAYRPEMIKWAYVSELIFETDFPLIRACSDPLFRLAEKTGKATSEIWKEDLSYVPIVIAAGHDPIKRNFTIAAFQINYLREHPYSENKYYSQAPLPTDVHIKFLEEFEADVLANISAEQIKSIPTVQAKLIQE